MQAKGVWKQDPETNIWVQEGWEWGVENAPQWKIDLLNDVWHIRFLTIFVFLKSVSKYRADNGEEIMVNRRLKCSRWILYYASNTNYVSETVAHCKFIITLTAARRMSRRNILLLFSGFSFISIDGMKNVLNDSISRNRSFVMSNFFVSFCFLEIK